MDRRINRELCRISVTAEAEQRRFGRFHALGSDEDRQSGRDRRFPGEHLSEASDNRSWCDQAAGLMSTPRSGRVRCADVRSARPRRSVRVARG
jgi:hypothetical protein